MTIVMGASTTGGVDGGVSSLKMDNKSAVDHVFFFLDAIFYTHAVTEPTTSTRNECLVPKKKISTKFVPSFFNLPWFLPSPEKRGKKETREKFLQNRKTNGFCDLFLL